MDGGNARNRSGAFPCGQIYRKWISAVQQEYGRYLERFDLVMKIQLDMYQTLAAAVLVLMLGAYLKVRYIFWSSFVFRLRLSVVYYLPFSPASVT